MLDVQPRSAFGDYKRAADLPIGQPLSHQDRNLALTRRPGVPVWSRDFLIEGLRRKRLDQRVLKRLRDIRRVGRPPACARHRLHAGGRWGYPLQPGVRNLGSSWQSLQRGLGSIEADFLNGEIVRLGRLHGMPTPYNEVLQEVANAMAVRHEKPGKFSVEELEAWPEHVSGHWIGRSAIPRRLSLSGLLMRRTTWIRQSAISRASTEIGRSPA